MALQEATRNWSEELAVAGKRITKASLNLQLAFATASHGALNGGDEVIPDPIKLVHRVVALELAMKIIEKDCQELAEKRKRVVMDVMKRQNKCVDSLNKLEERLTNHRSREEPSSQLISEKDHDEYAEWKRLADQLASQIAFFENEICNDNEAT